MKVPVKNLLILSYFIKDIDLYYGRLQHFGLSFSGLIYVIFFFLLLLCVFTVAHIKNNIVRIILGVIFFLSAVAYDSYYRIMMEYLDYNAYINMIDAVGFAGEAFQQFILSYITSIGLGLLLLIGIILKPKIRTIQKRYAGSLLLVAFVLFTSLIFYKGGSGASGLPAIFTPISYSSLAIYEASQDKYGTRENILIKRANRQVEHDIIYIIDESVTPQYLDINEEFGVSTSLKKEYPSINIYNYGYAASITNCSMASNLTLRYGGTRDAYMKIISTKPSIWQYAKNAGLKTVYIDAQETGGYLQNGMTNRELLDIDEFIQLDGIDIQQRDQEVSKMIVDLINNDNNEFIIINKIGAHFPVHDKYPDDYIIYKPILHRGNWLDIAHTGEKIGFNGSQEEWIRYRNSYRNTIEWNVAKFFNNIFENANLSNSLIIYTSDHGQDLHESNNPGVNTHCSSNPNIEEGLVPLVILQGKNLNTIDWQNGVKLNKDKSSHYNIFPSLLKVMHYDSFEVVKDYGETLDTITNDDFTFNINWNSRLGQKPEWQKIDLNKIVRPSKNDYSK